MVKKHGKKQRAKNRSRRTGAAHASAAANTLHTHEPLPDMAAVLGTLPHTAGHTLNTDLAARLVASCHAKCLPCQKSLAKVMRQEANRPTLAALAAAIYGTLPTAGAFASVTTTEWAPVARATMALGEGMAALDAVRRMTDEQASDLLEDTLDHWAMRGISAEELAATVKITPGVPPRQRPAAPMASFRKAGIKVVTLDDLDLGDDVDTYHLAENYGVFPGQTETDQGPMPMLTLYPETEGAGIEDLERQTNWEHWGLHGMPDMDPRWRVRARIADRSLRGLVHVGPEGEDDLELWRASETVTMPADWWDLLDRVQHVLVVGPCKEPEHQALQAAGDAGELLAVVARVAFV